MILESRRYVSLLNDTLLVAFEEILSDSAVDILSFVPCEGISYLRPSFFLVDSGCWVRDREAFSEKISLMAYPWQRYIPCKYMRLKLPRV